MKVFVILAVCDQPDTRVDQGAEIKEILCVMKTKPSKTQESKLLEKHLNAQGDDENDMDWSISAVETTLA